MLDVSASQPFSWRGSLSREKHDVPSAPSLSRFTLDGSDSLESHLADVCRSVRDGICKIIPGKKIEAILLGGGYGRGEGGVLKNPATGQDSPYNDLEFYVFIRGNRVFNRRRFGDSLDALGKQLSPDAGLHVEFKIESLDNFRRAPITMFSYDLMAGHKAVFGDEGLFEDCAHHLKPENIPLSEATRLLFNRCSGLLLAKELLARESVSDTDADFIGRNIAKAQLAFGDAVLVANRLYHWSCRERHERLLALPPDAWPELSEIRRQHAAAVEFKLHPRKCRLQTHQLEALHRETSLAARELWLRIESLRLKKTFACARDYALSSAEKCFDGPGWRNRLLNLRTFGPRALVHDLASRYPRERLYNALTLLLWEGESARDFDIKTRLQNQLQTTVSDWLGLVAAYKRVWPRYG